MSAIKEIKFDPKAFAECLGEYADITEEAAQKISDRATSYITGKGSGFHVEMTNEPKWQDSAYGVSRPVAYVTPNDDETNIEEIENKIFSKAVRG